MTYSDTLISGWIAILPLSNTLQNKCQTALLNFLRIRSIWQYLDDTTTERLVLSLCMSHIDYCNSVLYGLPDCSIYKLERVQNMCACLVLRKTKSDSITQCLHQLHWLPVRKRIAFKVLVLTFKLLCRDGAKYSRIWSRSTSQEGKAYTQPVTLTYL